MANDKAPAVPKVESLAFFTTNDSRPSLGIGVKAPPAAKLTSTQRYQKRAESLATAGRITRTVTSSRQVQLGAKLLF